MKKLYIVANWKSHMGTSEANEWLQKISNFSPRGEAGKFQISNGIEKEIIVCPPFTLLQNMKYKIGTFNSQMKVGAQDASPFEEGPYTGEIAAAMLKEFCSYVIVGHSERREKFSETDEVVMQKLDQTVNAGLTTILCVSDIGQAQSAKRKVLASLRSGQSDSEKFKNKLLIAFEPLSAIGTGKADSPENANNMIKEIKGFLENTPVLYGGSVTPENVRSFTEQEAIDGVLVGSASLDAEKFVQIIQNA